MGSCFIIQPFDHDRFEKRYEDVFAPAVRDAGLDPYRVDRDPTSVVLIDAIEAGIKAADICFAEITTDNANVWYELGFAIAAGKSVVLACDETRERFPFDIQHRRVVRYKTQSGSDFDKARQDIATQLAGSLHAHVATASVASASVAAPRDGLTPEQLAALVVIAQRTGIARDAISVYELTHEMGNVGFTDIATTLGVRGLIRAGLAESFDESDFNGNEYVAFRATDAGLEWLDDNRESLVLRQPDPIPPRDDLADLPF